jgi:hypothetical protein
LWIFIGKIMNRAYDASQLGPLTSSHLQSVLLAALPHEGHK